MLQCADYWSSVYINSWLILGDTFSVIASGLDLVMGYPVISILEMEGEILFETNWKPGQQIHNNQLFNPIHIELLGALWY